MTEVPADALRRRARAGLHERAERAPARAHFRAMGVAPARLGRPIIGGAGTIELPAIIEGDPQGTQVVSAAIAGRVVALTRNLGQSVGRGQTIAVIESREAAQIKGEVEAARV